MSIILVGTNTTQSASVGPGAGSAAFDTAGKASVAAGTATTVYALIRNSWDEAKGFRALIYNSSKTLIGHSDSFSRASSTFGWVSAALTAESGQSLAISYPGTYYIAIIVEANQCYIAGDDAAYGIDRCDGTYSWASPYGATIPASPESEISAQNMAVYLMGDAAAATYSAPFGLTGVG